MISSQHIDAKASLRERARDVLVQMKADRIAEVSAAIQGRVLQLDEFRSCSCVMLYAPYGAEVKTDQILSKALAMGKNIYLPVFNGAEYRPGRYDPVAGLVPGRYGIMEPKQSARESAPSDLFVVTPGLAFDRRGHRLGKGLGYYDRMLSALKESGTACFCAGLVYEQNLYAEIPCSVTDVNMDVVVTENETVRCSLNTGSIFQNYGETG